MSCPEVLAQQVEDAVLKRDGRREGKEIRFLCPAHDDHNPSARWNPEKQVRCCDACGASGGWKDLASKLGINTAAEQSNARRLVATYDYCDEHGTPLYQVLRYEMPDGFTGAFPSYSATHGATQITGSPSSSRMERAGGSRMSKGRAAFCIDFQS